MLLLASTADKFNLVSSSTAALDVQASWVDYSSGSATPGRTNTAIASGTTSAIVGAPAAGVTRFVKQVTALNRGTTVETITLIHTDGSLPVELIKTTLQAGEALHYVDGSGFICFTSDGLDKGRYLATPPIPTIWMGPQFPLCEASTTLAPTSQTAYAVYLGKAPQALTAMTLRWRVTTLAATITYAELAIATGNPSIDSPGVRLTMCGFTSVSTPVATPAIYNTQITGLSISEGEGLWGVYAIQATTVGAIRAMTSAETFGANSDTVLYSASLATTRPSTSLNRGLPFVTYNGTSPWFAFQYS